MNIATLSTKIPLPTEQFPKSHWKAGLFVANFVCVLFLIRYGWSLPERITLPSGVIVIGLFLYAGFTQLKHLRNGRQVMAYLKDHEGWVLVSLTILLITGSISYVKAQTRLDYRATANGEPNSVSPFTEPGANQAGLSSRSAASPTSALEAKPDFASPAVSPAPLPSDPPVTPVTDGQGVANAQLQRKHSEKRNHLRAAHHHRSRLKHRHA